ncbi:hypothetical protein GCM10009550_53550 [Actinocorallia libanotica]|uniref:Uncharacterized protein n=1 Tax=Actinocorallia libanotica TaxID=46162 RepID=A0ABN1RPQ0_9ACTN
MVKQDWPAAWVGAAWAGAESAGTVRAAASAAAEARVRSFMGCLLVSGTATLLAFRGAGIGEFDEKRAFGRCP